MDWKPVTISDTFIILATILGPIIAVQLQKFIEWTSERRNRRDILFKTLMATRAVRAGSLDHVQALNMIDLYFDGKSQKEKNVRNAWKMYFDQLERRLDPNAPDVSAQIEKAVDLLVDLLHAMSEALGYDFDKVQIKRGAYYPQGHHDDATARQIIRDGMVRVALGQAALPVIVYPPPAVEEPKQPEARSSSAAS